MARKMKKWSEMLTEKDERRSKVYREGAKFVYDSGDLPDGLMGVGVGCVLCLQRTHGISATQMPGTAEDWVVVGGGSGGGGGAAFVIDPTLSSTSSNPVQNKVVKAALDGKMDANQAFKTVNGLSLKGSGNITLPGCQCEVPFTTALRNKLNALPTITLNGNTIIINGTAFTLTPAGSVTPDPEDPGQGGEDPETAKDYYVGFTNGTKSEFAALSAGQLANLAEGLMIASKDSYAHAFGSNQIFFLLYQSGKAPQSVVLTSSGQSMTQDLTNDNTCPHDPVTLDGVTYQVFGIRLSSSHDAGDTISLTF